MDFLAYTTKPIDPANYRLWDDVKEDKQYQAILGELISLFIQQIKLDHELGMVRLRKEDVTVCFPEYLPPGTWYHKYWSQEGIRRFGVYIGFGNEDYKIVTHVFYRSNHNELGYRAALVTSNMEVMYPQKRESYDKYKPVKYRQDYSLFMEDFQYLLSFVRPSHSEVMEKDTIITTRALGLWYYLNEPLDSFNFLADILPKKDTKKYGEEFFRYVIVPVGAILGYERHTDTPDLVKGQVGFIDRESTFPPLGRYLADFVRVVKNGTPQKIWDLTLFPVSNSMTPDHF